VKSELFWLFYDDVFSGWIPPNHMMVFWTLKEPVRKEIQTEGGDTNVREEGMRDTNA